MGKKLAIVGHSTRGNEVIELLEMLGGVAAATKGFRESYCYYISEDTATKYISWDYIGPEEIEKYKIFTLEEFLEKYPFKVGDKVVYTKFGDNCDDYPVTIESMEWTGTTIEYTFNDCVTCLAKDLKIWNSNDMRLKIEKNMNIEFDLKKYSYEVKDGKLIIGDKKPTYPKTYGECCTYLGLQHCGLTIDLPFNYSLLFISLAQLYICRNAYWKIAGEEMGLGKPWKPDYTDLKNTMYGLYNELKYSIINPSQFVFQTEEMRDAFYENFKDLIEQCK